MKICPNCKLSNPDESQKCDCGYIFNKGKFEKNFVPRNGSPNSKSKLIVGVLINIFSIIFIFSLFIWAKQFPYAQKAGVRSIDEYISMGDNISLVLIILFLLITCILNFLIFMQLSPQYKWKYMLLNLPILLLIILLVVFLVSGIL